MTPRRAGAARSAAAARKRSIAASVLEMHWVDVAPGPDSASGEAVALKQLGGHGVHAPDITITLVQSYGSNAMPQVCVSGLAWPRFMRQS